MRSLFLLAALLLAVTVSSSSVASKATNDGKKQRAVMQFTEPVRLQGVLLKGEYLFIHDDAAMMRGETCTFVYEGNREVASKLVVSFHCTPTQRSKVNTFTIRTEQGASGVELREIQFSGDTESHVVPVK